MVRLSTLILLLTCCGLIIACNQISEPMVEATIIGSTHTPDPILKEVEQLQQKGIIKDVMVMESFPVQIRLMAPPEIIRRLRAKSIALAKEKK